MLGPKRAPVPNRKYRAEIGNFDQARMETSISRTSAQSFKCQCKMVAKLGKCVFLVPKRFPFYIPKKYYAMPKIQIFNFH